MALLKSLISWVGGKKALRELIYQRFPKNYGRYIEVFGGGGWVLFGKKPDKFEAVSYTHLDVYKRQIHNRLSGTA